MAQTTANILIGPATVFIDPANGDTENVSPTEVGHTKGPATYQPAYTDYEVKSEQVVGPLRSVPTDVAFTVKIPTIESTLETMRLAMRQPTANLSGDGQASDKVLRVGSPAEQYHQVKLSGPGLGAAGTRDVFIWKAALRELAEVGISKEGEQLLEMSLMAMIDTTIAGADKALKLVDSM